MNAGLSSDNCTINRYTDCICTRSTWSPPKCIAKSHMAKSVTGILISLASVSAMCKKKKICVCFTEFYNCPILFFCTSIWNLVSWGNRKYKINHYADAERKFLHILFSNMYQSQSAHPNPSQTFVQSSSNIFFCFRQIWQRTTNYNTIKILLI